MSSSSECPGLSHDLQRLAQIAVNALDRVRSHVMWRVKGAAERSSEAVLAAGDRINRIVNDARSQVGEVQEQLGQLSEHESDGGSLIDLIDAHSKTVTGYVESLSRDIDAQTRTADKAVEQVQRIAEVGGRMDQVARETKIVAFNATLEAARLGDDGKPMLVIASEMRRLNEEVEELNGVVTELTAELRNVLPVVAELAREIHRDTRRFSDRVERQFSSVARQSQALRDSVGALLANGDARLNNVVDLAYDALSQLQFQDPVQQDLELIEVDLSKAIGFIEALISCGGDVAEMRSRFAPTGEATRSHTRGLRQEQIVVDDDGATVEAGEVLLF